jgi:ABC-type Fe3+-hydroxamate transport system substrate-binding protein
LTSVCRIRFKDEQNFAVRAGKNKEFIPIIGGTKTFHVDRIESLKPDLIIASKEENDKTLVEACTRFADVLVTGCENSDRCH